MKTFKVSFYSILRWLLRFGWSELFLGSEMISGSLGSYVCTDDPYMWINVQYLKSEEATPIFSPKSSLPRSLSSRKKCMYLNRHKINCLVLYRQSLKLSGGWLRSTLIASKYRQVLWEQASGYDHSPTSYPLLRFSRCRLDAFENGWSSILSFGTYSSWRLLSFFAYGE